MKTKKPAGLYVLSDVDINIIQIRARRFFARYRQPYLTNDASITCDDLEQDCLVRALEVIRKYEKTKPEEDIKKLIQLSVTWYLMDNLGKVITRKETLLPEGVMEDLLDNKDSQTANDLFSITDFKKRLTAKEYDIIKKKIVEGKTHTEIAKDYGVVVQHSRRTYKRTLAKIQTILKEGELI